MATTTLTGVRRSSVSARWQGWLGLGVTLAAIAVVGLVDRVAVLSVVAGEDLGMSPVGGE